MVTTPSQLVWTEEVQASTIGDQVPNPPAGSLALFSNQNDIWYAKNHAGAVVALSGVTSVTNSDGTIVITGTATVPIVSRAAITGDVAVNAASNTSTLAAVITAGGPTGSASVVPVVTYDAKGRLTAVSTATITPSAIGAVAGVTAADGSITMGGTATNPTVSRSALTGDITASAGSNATVLKNTGPGATGPIGDASHVATVTIDAQGRTTALSSTAIAIAESAVTNLVSDLAGKVPTTRNVNTTAPLTGGGALSSDLTLVLSQTGTGVSVAKTAAVFQPKDIEGEVYVDPTNTMGWAGADAGAWINSAFAYLLTTYGTATVGGVVPAGFTGAGIIHLAPGVYTFTTPIVCCDQWFSIKIKGSGEGVSQTPTGTAGKGGTVLNYTPTSGAALTIGGASSNNGGVQCEDFALFGGTVGTNAVVPGGSAIGIQFGLTGGAPPPGSSTAGATLTNVAVVQFATGENWNASGSIAYAVTHINCKVQYCITGAVPFGEANVWFGGLFGNNTTAIGGTNSGTDANFFGTAFDDNGTIAFNITQALWRATLEGCRFENAGGGTDQYITMSAGSLVMNGGSMQSDIVAAGTGSGFINLSGTQTTFSCKDTWLLGQGSRTFTQIINVTGGTPLIRFDPIIAPTSVGITQLVTAGFSGVPKRPDYFRLTNRSTTVQAITAAVAPGSYITSSNINLPNPMAVGIAVGTAFEWEFAITKTALGTTNFSFIFFAGTNGTTADTQLVTVSFTQTAVVDSALVTATLVCATAGASGTFVGNVSAAHTAAIATGFGFGQTWAAAVTSGAFNTTTAGLKFGMGVASATGAPVLSVGNVKAKVFNLD